MSVQQRNRFSRAERVLGMIALVLVLLVGYEALTLRGGNTSAKGDTAQQWCRAHVRNGDSAPKLYLSVPTDFGLGQSAPFMANGYWTPTGYSPYAGDGVSLHFSNGRVNWYQCG